MNQAGAIYTLSIIAVGTLVVASARACVCKGVARACMHGTSQTSARLDLQSMYCSFFRCVLQGDNQSRKFRSRVY
ncbi:hypothetical protein BDU57DRAFT_520130 [Ampelomyces quisqualis]|uniref:Secreted protein n=1 Tax=Ampelomyces quisqualis TaxID=50730 RepID=A0A6A5QKA6_AMPQU|nr:hypothetical protein BDU57DRAFT_520130 [Ampelomyces quisqualis]